MLAGRAAVVTGSTSGIGLGIARALAREGANVMLNGFGEPADIERMRRTLEEESGTTVRYCPADVSKPGDAARLVEETVHAFDAIDILVNNAGIQHVAPLESFDPERWDAVLALNLSSNFHTIRTALPHMRRRDWGRIVNVASTHGLVGSPFKSAYVAAKHGVIGLTKVVALETAATAITCNAICPGWVLTPLVRQQIDVAAERDDIAVAEAERRLLAEKQPSLSFVTPDQVGALATYLCSDAAAQIRGPALTIDGGWTAQ